MESEFKDVIVGTVELLTRLPKWSARLDEARDLFTRFRAGHLSVDMELVSHPDPEARTVDFDVLLQLPGGGVLTLSYTPDDGIPWSVLYGEEMPANIIVTVNRQQVTIEQALLLMRWLYGDGVDDPAERLVEGALIREALGEDPPDVTDEELQQAADRFRLAHGLAAEADTREWLAQHHLTEAAFEQFILDQVQARKLMEQVTAPDLETWFAAHHAEFESAQLDADTRLTIQERLFRRWLEQRRQSASIVWHRRI